MHAMKDDSATVPADERELMSSLESMIQAVCQSNRRPVTVGLFQCSVGLLLAAPLVAWLILWLGLDFRWWTALLLGGAGGLVVGIVVMVICLFASSSIEERWKARLAAALENAFHQEFPDEGLSRRAAKCALSRLIVPDLEWLVFGLLQDLQRWQTDSELASKESRPQCPRPCPAPALEQMRAITSDMETVVRQRMALVHHATNDKTFFRLGLESDAIGFDKSVVPLYVGEEVLFTLDPYSPGAVGAVAAGGEWLTVVGTDRRILFCRDWIAVPFQWFDVVYLEVETVRLRTDPSSTFDDGLLIFELCDGDVRVYRGEELTCGILGGFFTELIKISGAEHYRPSGDTPDLETAKREWDEVFRSCEPEQNDVFQDAGEEDDESEMLRCNACGHRQREGEWDDEMDRRAKAMGSRGFVNLSAPDQCLVCGSTELVEASRPKNRSGTTSDIVARIAAEFVELGRKDYVAVRSVDTATQRAVYEEARTLTEEARNEGILYDVLASLQRRRLTEEVKSALALLDAHFQK